MKKIWATVLLALALCAAETAPVLAQEDDGAEAVIVLTESEEPVDYTAESDIVDLGADTSKSGEPAADTLPEAVNTAENEWTVDLSSAPDISAIDLPENGTDSWGTAPIADADQSEVTLDAAHFPDEAFRSYLSKKFDTDGSGGLSTAEIAAVTEIDVIGKKISDLTGLAYFTKLTGLYCDTNQLTALDVSRNTKLTTLTCTGNLLGSLDVRQNTALLSLVCSNNQIKALDLSRNSNLQDLRCAQNQLQALDISGNTRLAWLDCSQNSLTTLDASDHQYLQYLFCSANQLSDLDVSGATNLQWLECQQNQLTELDVTGVLNVNATQDSAVNILNCADNKLTSLQINNKSYFKGLICNNNAITKLDLSTNPDLRQLECANNALTSLDVTSNRQLQTLDCSGNQITSLNLSNLSITTTTALPNCSGQRLPMPLEKTDNGLQINLKDLLGNENSNVIRMTREEFSEGNSTEKGKWGNVILLAQDDDSLNGNLQNGILTFTTGVIPEKIELFCATGYKKKTGEKDILLGITLCHTHTNELLERIEPTCEENGYEKRECAECGATAIEVFPALGHDYKPIEKKEATCKEDGYLIEQCTICGDSIIKELPAKHDYHFVKQMPTCTEDGWMYQQCSVCGDKEPETVLSAIGHDYKLVKETLPTCTAEGALLEKCSHCGDERSTAIPASGHEYELVKETPPTCTREGALLERCSRCGDEKTTVIPATGHEYGAYTIVREATIFADGLKRHTCSLCGVIQDAVIPKLNGTVTLSVSNLPLQIKEKVSVQSLVTGLQEDDCVVSWSSGDPEIAVISKNGTITAKQTGAVDITVTTKSGATAVMTVKVQVDKVKTKGISGLKKQITLTAGKKLKLAPVLKPISSQQKITYKSANKKVAQVSAKGVVKGIRKGTTKITVKSGNQKFVVKVKVKSAAVKKIKHVPAKKKLRKGTSFQLKPRLVPTGCSQKITYKSSNKEVATVTAKGVVKAKKKGTAKITVTAGKKKVICKITVIK